MRQNKVGTGGKKKCFVFLDCSVACGFNSVKDCSRVPGGAYSPSVGEPRQILITTRVLHIHVYGRRFGRGERTKLINSKNPPPTPTTLMAANPKWRIVPPAARPSANTPCHRHVVSDTLCSAAAADITADPATDHFEKELRHGHYPSTEKVQTCG